MQEDNNLNENFNEFNKLVIELENIGEKINDEDHAVILLNSFPLTYNQLPDTIKYGRDTLSLDYLESAIRSKELELKAERQILVIRLLMFEVERRKKTTRTKENQDPNHR